MRYRASIVVCSCLSGLALVTTESVAQPDVRRAVVRITALQRLPNLVTPWSKEPPQPVFGSGTVIEAPYIVTNAHLVMYATDIQAQPYASSERFPVRVVALEEGIDLALLEIEDHDRSARFFAQCSPLPLAPDLPRIQDTVTVYGYPMGGTNQSASTGIVSRIEYGFIVNYTPGLRIEIDAALNPGSSGGSAVVDGELTGLVFASSEKTGLLIGAEEIRAFLDRCQRGDRPGTNPWIWAPIQYGENAALRAKLGLDDDATGVLVCADHPADPDYPLRKGDFIIQVGEHPIDNLGTVLLADDLRLPFSYVVPKVARDDLVPLSVCRASEKLDLHVPLCRQSRRLIQPLRGKDPSYLVWGPLAFGSANRELVELLGLYLGELWTEQANPLRTQAGDWTAFEEQQLVVVLTMFSHPITAGYVNPVGQVVSQVNGIRIRNLRHLAEVLLAASDPYVTVEFAGRATQTLVFRREEAREAMGHILAVNGIQRPCSDDLQDLWQPGNALFTNSPSLTGLLGRALQRWTNTRK